MNKLIETAAERNIPVVYVYQEFSGFLGKIFSMLAGHGTAIKGKPGTELDRRLNIISEHRYSKPMPDAFSSCELEAFLKENGVKELYLVGLDAAGCIAYTAKGALKKGYQVAIMEDAIVTLTENKWDSLMKKLEQAGIAFIKSSEF